MTLHDAGDDSPAWVRLPWDSDHFGIPIGRLLPSSVSEGDLSTALRSVEDAGIRCLYWLSDSSDSQLEVAHRAGFKMVDVRVELEVQIGSTTAPPEDQLTIRVADESDLEPLKLLASRSHLNTRFYSDGGFAIDRADALYAAWIDRSFQDPSQVVAVSGPPGEPHGYIAFGISEAGAGAIGLIAVDESHRASGLGSGLVTAALSRLAWLGAEQVTVVTQGSNEAAQRLYTKLGFSERHRSVWFHRWFAG